MSAAVGGRSCPAGRARRFRFPAAKDRRSARQLADLDRLEARAPVEQALAGRRIVIGHRVDVDEAGAAQERAADVGERALGPVGGGDGEAQALLVVGQRLVRLGRIIEVIAAAMLGDVRRPEILGPARPGRLGRERVAEMLPRDEVARAGDLEVDPSAVALGLGGVGVMEAVRGAEDGGVGEVGVDDGVGEGGGCRSGAVGAARRQGEERGSER